MGGEGDKYFIFKALKQGNAYITFVYKYEHSSLDTSTILEQKTIQVEIK